MTNIMNTLYRAWHKEEKKMYFFDALWGNFSNGNGYIGMAEKEGERDSERKLKGKLTLIDPDSCEIMKCTGAIIIKDGVPRNVYCGDIVADNDAYYIVEWDNDSFVWAIKSIGEMPDYPAWELWQIFTEDSGEKDIIGNIYENPDLLK